MRIPQRVERQHVEIMGHTGPVSRSSSYSYFSDLGSASLAIVRNPVCEADYRLILGENLRGETANR